MPDHRIEIMTGGRIDPDPLVHVNALDKVTIANRSGGEVTITYPAGDNPFADTQEGASETLAHGTDLIHTISGEFDRSATYDLPVELATVSRETSPKIRITGAGATEGGSAPGGSGTTFT